MEREKQKGTGRQLFEECRTNKKKRNGHQSSEMTAGRNHQRRSRSKRKKKFQFRVSLFCLSFFFCRRNENGGRLLRPVATGFYLFFFFLVLFLAVERRANGGRGEVVSGSVPVRRLKTARRRDMDGSTRTDAPVLISADNWNWMVAGWCQCRLGRGGNSRFRSFIIPSEWKTACLLSFLRRSKKENQK